MDVSDLALFCANLIPIIVSNITGDDGPDFRGCTFYTGLVSATTQLNVSAVQTIDCKNEKCAAIFTKFVSYTSNCTIRDDNSRTDVLISTLTDLCLPTTYPATTVTTTISPSVSTSSPTINTINPTENSSSTTTTIAIISAAVVLIVGIIVYGYLRRRKQQQSTDFMVMYGNQSTPLHTHGKHTTMSSTINDESQQSVMQQYLSDLDMFRIPINEVKPIKPLAEGAFGEVWQGEYQNQSVALKRLLPNRRLSSDLEKFIWEIVLVSKIDCPYVVKFLGATWSRPSDIMLVTEFMENGDLRQVLEMNQTSGILSWQGKLKCAQHITEALVFLHLMQPIVIHRDLKSRNVLLDRKMNAKLTDFGIARERDDATMTAGIGTYRWMAPEVLVDGHYTESADIFSFGIILAELDTEIIPYSNYKNSKGNPYTDTALITKVIHGEILPSFNDTCPSWYVKLAKECLALDPLKRPTATMLAYRLKKSKDGILI